ncbi:hypothetical protein ACMFMG_001795 [Clarireedia jacksonii]
MSTSINTTTTTSSPCAMQSAPTTAPNTPPPHYTKPLIRSFSSCSTSSTTSTTSQTSNTSFSFLSPPLSPSAYYNRSFSRTLSSPHLDGSSRFESRHPSEMKFRGPLHFFENPEFFIPKRRAPAAPTSPRGC